MHSDKFIFTRLMKFNALMTMMSSLMLAIALAVHHIPQLRLICYELVLVSWILLGIAALGPIVTMIYFAVCFRAQLPVCTL